MSKSLFMNKNNGLIGTVMVATYDPEDDNAIKTYSYEYIEDMMAEWAAYEAKPKRLTISVECESEQEANRLNNELKEAQTLYKTWDKKNWETVIKDLKGEEYD